MGSPSARLSTPEHLRAFVDSGLTYVYAPGRAMAPGAAQTRGQAAPAHQGTRPDQSRPLRDDQPGQSGSGQAGRKQAAHPATGSSPAFPEPWATFFAKAAPRPRIVWTYMELGLDLAGQADPRRSGVLRNLIAHLRWERGTSVFWPVAALQGGALQPDRAMFWKGWEQWRTPYIACFGQEALAVIHPQAEPGCSTVFLEQVTIHVLPPLAELITRLPHEQQMAVDVLSGLHLSAD